MVLIPGLESLNDPRAMFKYQLSKFAFDPFVSISERNFDITSNFPILAWHHNLDLAEVIRREFVVKNLKHAVKTEIEFSFFGLAIV